MGPGTFVDSGRLSSTNIPASLPRGTNLIGAGKSQTVYKGRIDVPLVNNQTISDFHLDGRENMTAATAYFDGLMIKTGDKLTVKNLRIEGFHANGIEFGRYNGLSNSSLHHNELVNNGKHTQRGFGMRTGNMSNCEIYDNLFLEERGKGGEPWNTGPRTLTNVKIYNNTFKTHRDTKAGWNGQNVFNFEFFTTDCLNVEVYNNQFDGSLSLVDPSSPRANKTPFSIRVYSNTWTYTKRYGIEAAMAYLEIDHNYFHFGSSLDIDEGGGYTAITGSDRDFILIHHNVFEDAPQYAIHSFDGDNVEIYNNTAIALKVGSSVPRFINVGSSTASRSNWSIVNNIFRCHPDRAGKFTTFDTGSYAMPGLRIKNNAIFAADSGLTSTLLASSNVTAPIVANPRFVEYGDKTDPYYRLLATSPLLNAGAIIPGITDGYIGSGPDIGALEGAGSQNAPLLALGTELIFNGGFENPGADVPFSFNADQGVIDWVSAGTLTSNQSSVNTNPSAGNWHASIYLGGWGQRSIAQTTKHVIRSGDVYTLKFDHNVGFATNPKLGMRLFYEDNGQRIHFFEWVDPNSWSGSSLPWRTATLSNIAVPAAAVGRPIGVWFTNTISSQRVYVDAVSLKRTAGPVGSTGVQHIEAEIGSIFGGATIRTSPGGYEGSGFVNPVSSNSGVQFSGINGGSGGSQTLDIRHSLRSGSRTVNLIVNGITQTLTFTSTGSWSTWEIIRVPISLNSGSANTVRISSSGQDSANLDWIKISGVQ